MLNDIEVYIAGLNKLPEPVSPSGSTKTAACVQRSVSEHGRPGPFLSLTGRACGVQQNEGAAGRIRESDPPIVAGDGNTGHVAKGRAEEQSRQRTDAAERMSALSVSSSLPGDRTRGLKTLRHDARSSEEPGAAIPHAGICEGAVG